MMFTFHPRRANSIGRILVVSLIGMSLLFAPAMRHTLAVCDPDAAITEVSRYSSGASSFDFNRFPAMSTDGRYVVFSSSGALIPSDTNGAEDVYFYDRFACSLTLISVKADGSQSTGFSNYPDVSNNGRYVAFVSDGADWGAGDTNGVGDIFRKDRYSGAVIPISVSSGGVLGNGLSTRPSISGSGRYIAFVSRADNLVPNDTNARYDVFVRDVQTNTTTRISVTSSGEQQEFDTPFISSGSSAISADGRYVAFDSMAYNLVAGITPQCSGSYCNNVYVHDRTTGQTTRINVTEDGAEANGNSMFGAMSEDGRYIGFVTWATNLFTPDANNSVPDSLIRDRVTNQLMRVSYLPNGQQFSGGVPVVTAISADASSVGFMEDFYGDYDFYFVTPYLHDPASHETVKFSPGRLMGISNDTIWGLVENKQPTYGSIYLVQLHSPEIVPNGDFSEVEPSGVPTGWDTFGDILLNTVGGVVQMEWNGVGSVLTRKVNTPQSINTPMSVEFQMGNSSAIRKRVTVLLHASDFSDLLACTFWLTPDQPLRDYRMRTHNTIEWIDTMVSFYPTGTGGGGRILLDNVSVVVDPYFARADSVRCVDPNAPD